jgi:condensin complex subunit 2
VKKFELEFSVDPLFKKASADFDEGGAKGLLLNHLAIDYQGRIVFDSSDDATESNEKNDLQTRADETEETDNGVNDESTNTPRSDGPGSEGDASTEDLEIDISALAAQFFPTLNIIDEQDICPSLKGFDLGDAAGASEIPFLKASEEWKQDHPEAEAHANRSGILLDDDNAAGFDDDDGGLGGFDLPADTGFGEGGEVWARDAAIEPQTRPFDGAFDDDGGAEGSGNMEVGSYEADAGEYGVMLLPGHQRDDGGHENILSYFDQALKKNWAGPEHWRIRKIKDNAKSATPTTKTRKEKEPFEIDFLAPLDPALAEAIYTPASSNSAISLPKAQWRSKSRNLLPDDKHFNSKQLLRLFLKPRARMGSKRPGFATSKGRSDIPEGEVDEAYWAQKEDPNGRDVQDGEAGANYDANFFQDDGLAFPGGLPDDDDDEFADARDHFSPALENDEVQGPGNAGMTDALAGTHEGGFGSQLVTQSRRLRPEYVQYARVAKKVDVRRLKEEMWKGMGIDETSVGIFFSRVIIMLIGD